MERNVGLWINREEARIVQPGRAVIFGPGDTKLELKKILDSDKKYRQIDVVLEKADRRTRRQFAADIRRYFDNYPEVKRNEREKAE